MLDWDLLSMKLRAAFIRNAVARGIYNVEDIVLDYNEFKKGGPIETPIYEDLPKMLRKAGLDVKVTSGYRPAGTVGTAGLRSWHHRHGAVDIVPQGNTTFEDIENVLHNNPAIRQYMLSHNFGLIDESGRTPESKLTMKKTGATGAHFHIGKDSKYAALYRQRVGAALPEGDRGKTVYFTNPFLPLEQPTQLILVQRTATPEEILQNVTIPEPIKPDEDIQATVEIPEVEVIGHQPQVNPLTILSLIQESAPTPLVLEPYLIPLILNRVNEIATLRNSFLQKDLEDRLLAEERRRRLGYSYKDSSIEDDIKLMLFLRNMSANGGPLSDSDYYTIMERVAKENNEKWNLLRALEGAPLLSVDEEYLRILNDNAYDYRGYYNKYPQSKASADTHWTDEFKTAFHPTFSIESGYSGKKSQYNPNGYLGGVWLKNGLFVPTFWQLNMFGGGGNLFSGEEEGNQQMQIQRSSHIDLAVTNPWLYHKLHPTPKEEYPYEPSTFAGRVAQLVGVDDLGQKFTDYTSSTIQQLPIVGTAISAVDLGYDINRLYHSPSLTATKDVTLDAASLLPALRKTMKGLWMKGNSGSFITETGQIINNPRVASNLEVILQPFRTAINTGVYGARAADFLDDSKAYLKEMYNSSKIGKHFPIKAYGGPLNPHLDINSYDGGGLIPMINIPSALKNGYNAVKNRLYRTITPQGYHLGRAAKEFIKGDTRDFSKFTPAENEVWARYLGVPYEGESNFEKAIYTPTKGGATYDDVIKFKDESLILSDDVLRQLLQNQMLTGKNTMLIEGNESGLGTYTLSLGEDENGKYISYYDDWDINPTRGLSAKYKIPIIDQIGDVVPGSNPFTVYGRRYYTDEDLRRVIER